AIASEDGAGRLRHPDVQRHALPELLQMPRSERAEGRVDLVSMAHDRAAPPGEPVEGEGVHHGVRIDQPYVSPAQDRSQAAGTLQVGDPEQVSHTVGQPLPISRYLPLVHHEDGGDLAVVLDEVSTCVEEEVEIDLGIRTQP